MVHTCNPDFGGRGRGLKDEGHTQLQNKPEDSWDHEAAKKYYGVFKSSLKTKPGFPKSL